jgi:hypothetical protein
MVFFTANANAAIVNLDARLNGTGNTVDLSLTAGTYSITPIGTANGGDYNAWYAWTNGVTGCDSNGENCSRGWIHSYGYESSEIGTVNVGSNGTDNRYATDLLALDHSLGSLFTLTSDAVVSFFIRDYPLTDNAGGISLDVTAVPLPAAAWLFGSALLGFVGLSRRRAV